jgi:superfamily II DNA or RNA helicase
MKQAQSKPTQLASDGLRSVSWKRFLRAPDAQLVDDLYAPALSRAVRYDRCCAYFSSRVLAVAARGFGGFIENLLKLGDDAPKPSARLLVNEQLDPADVQALLATGDQSKLVDKLLKQFKTPTDALEKNRLEMLAWLVASGLLEVRVGLMRHTQGIAHAKFGLITDRHGDVLGFMGSDNETGAALLDNYEELQLSPSWQDEEFVQYYRERFCALWKDHDPFVTTLPLPDAVREKLIQIAPIEPPQETDADRKHLEAAMLCHFLAAAPYLPNGEYGCDATAMVEMWPHQRRVVEDTSRAFPAGRLLCDEVGMGKTLEAILTLRRLLCGRGVQRALLLVPAGLLTQWQDELREKGGLLVPRWDDGFLHYPNGRKEKMDAADALAKNPLLLLSREWARLDANRNLVLTAPPWDLVLLDEAHAARRNAPEETGFNSANLLLGLLREMQLRRRARGILLLSATPMQTQPWEPWDLLAVLGVGGAWMADFGDIRTYYDGVAALLKGGLNPKSAQGVARLIHCDPDFPAPPDGLNTQDPAKLANGLVFTTSSKRKQLSDWLRRGAPLGRYMHRNTRDTLRQYHQRGLLAQPPARRHVEDVLFDYTDQSERDVYDAVATYINERFDQLERQKKGKGFVMTIYRRRASSSPLALRRSLERRLEGLERVIRQQHLNNWLTAEEIELDVRDLGDADLDVVIDPALPTSAKEAEAERARIRGLLQKLTALGATDSKLAKFFEVLTDAISDGRAALVFTEYADTMEYLRDKLLPHHGSQVATYSGGGGQVWDGQGWQTTAKADITERLRKGDIRVLVCTDAASEGLNLQAASALIQYDLPWNPSKCEQRIGRIDRIGQVQTILPIRNLFLRDSVDMLVYQALKKRCGLFEHFVGRMQPVLALARDALKSNLRREQTDQFLQALNHLADKVEGDQATASAYAESEAEQTPSGIPPITRSDYRTALLQLAGANCSVKVTPVKGRPCWRISGLWKKAVTVTADRESLERDRDLLPLTAGSEVLRQLTAKLPLNANRVPLVVGVHVSGPYRCTEVRWVDGTSVIEFETFSQLLQLVQGWQGGQPSPSVMVKAQAEARKAARKRVAEMEAQGQAREEANLKSQHAAARLRLKRELARTLRCFGSGDLNLLLQQQIQREVSSGRYHRALALLGGSPDWSHEDQSEATAYVNAIGSKERQSRINLASEIEAALNDPRWRASGAGGWS